jgi:proteasome beta subunit
MDEDLKKHVLKTGTLTVGVVCKDGIVLAADRRVTYGGDSGVSYIAGDHKKIEEINERTLVTTAGVASDSRRVIKLARAELKLKELKNKTPSSIKEIANLLANIAYDKIRTPSVILSITHFLIAGHDSDGAHLFDVGPAGDISEIKTYQATGAPFESLGIFDVDYKKNMSIDEGIKMAKKVFEATRGRQPGVGDGFDVYVIESNKIKEISSERIISKLSERDKE